MIVPNNQKIKETKQEGLIFYVLHWHKQKQFQILRPTYSLEQ